MRFLILRSKTPPTRGVFLKFTPRVVSYPLERIFFENTPPIAYHFRAISAFLWGIYGWVLGIPFLYGQSEQSSAGQRLRSLKLPPEHPRQYDLISFHSLAFGIFLPFGFPFLYSHSGQSVIWQFIRSFLSYPLQLSHLSLIAFHKSFLEIFTIYIYPPFWNRGDRSYRPPQDVVRRIISTTIANL